MLCQKKQGFYHEKLNGFNGDKPVCYSTVKKERKVTIFVRIIFIAAMACIIIFPCNNHLSSARENPSRWTPEFMIHFKRLGQTAVSPDGTLIAYTISTPLMDGEKSEYLTHIRVVSTDGVTNYQFTHGDNSCSSPAFSPDGRYLSFTSRRSGSNQVWLLRMTGGDAERLTDAENGVSSYDWSPDCSRIAYTMRNPDTSQEREAKREKRHVRKLDADYKFSHLYTITVDRDSSGERKVQRLTDGDFHVTTFDWSPDNGTIAFGHQPTPSPDDWLSTDISSVPADSGKVRSIVSGKGTERFPLYSPDGKWLAYASDGSEPNWAPLSDIYVIPAGGGTPRKLSSTPDRSFTYYGSFTGWSYDSKELLVRETSRTNWRIFAVPVDGGPVRTVTTGPGSYTSASLGRTSDVMAFLHQTTDTPPEVHVSGLNRFKLVRLTNHHDGGTGLPMGKTEVITWKSEGGLEIEGLLTFPIGYTAGQRCPLILDIHGGPHSFFSETYTGEGARYPIQAFAQEGYAVLRPNPRGSSGYGKDFRFATMNDWGYGDYDDLMAGVDNVIDRGVAHPDSLCVMGWSYGGYMTAMVVTKTDRFKAASMGAGLSNLMSFTGTTDIPGFIPNYFGGEYWDNIEAYMKHSANFAIKGVTTPTQVLHGALDLRVPLPQGREFYHALKLQGCTTEMIVYPRTYHAPREPKLILDVGRRVLDWFNLQLGRTNKSSLPDE